MSYTTNLESKPMFPGTYHSDWWESHNDWEDFTKAVEYLPGPNQVLSWVVSCRRCYELEGDDRWAALMMEGEPNAFRLYLHSPRNSSNGYIEFTVPADQELNHAQIDRWIERYLKSRILEWYGFQDLVEPEVWETYSNR